MSARTGIVLCDPARAQNHGVLAAFSYEQTVQLIDGLAESINPEKRSEIGVVATVHALVVGAPGTVVIDRTANGVQLIGISPLGFHGQSMRRDVGTVGGKTGISSPSGKTILAALNTDQVKQMISALSQALAGEWDVLDEDAISAALASGQ